MNRKTIFIVGAGQLGSRHLQALKNVVIPLEIIVIDPSSEALQLAKQRYVSVDSSSNTYHKVDFFTAIPGLKYDIDIAIIATNSNVRRKVIETLFLTNNVKFMILEKLLFSRLEDYLTIAKLLNKNKTLAWVNCSMRTMPFYQTIKKLFVNSVINYTVTGSQYGLITNSIHYIDHMMDLTECCKYKVDTAHLNVPSINSKRKGFLEFNGVLQVYFEDGSIGEFSCFPSGHLPVQVEIVSKDARCISREWEGKAWISEFRNNWAWKEVDAVIPFQSQMTKDLVESILTKNSCVLVSYKESMNAHIELLQALLKFLNSNSKQQFDYYPFT